MEETNTTTNGEVVNTEVNNNVVDNKSNEGQEVKTFTQEEVNEIISKRLAKEKKSMEKQMEEFKASFGKEKFDEGLSEAEKLSKMTEAEKREYEFNKRVAEFEAKEKAMALKELQTEAKSQLSELGYGAEAIEKLSGLIDYTDAKSTKASIDNLHSVLNEVIEAQVTAQVNSKLKNTVLPPTNNATTGDYSWDRVLDGTITYSEWNKHNKR